MNQDYVFASNAPVGNLPNLFAVADGMGGHNAGDYASSHAVRVLVDEIREDTDYNPVKVIRHAIEAANTEIRNRAQEDENLRGMGTTMVVATVVDQYAYVANVGDSRLYVIQDGIRQVTRDHSLVQEMVRMGEISEAEARNHPDKNIITRALGAEKTVDVDFFDLKLEKGSEALNYFNLGLEQDDISKKLKKEMQFNVIVAYEQMEDWESAEVKLEDYLASYPNDKAAKKEAEFLKTR